MRKLVWVVIAGWALVACQRTQPQRPIVRGEVKDDPTVVQLLTLNQQKAAQADQQLAQIAPKGYVLMEDNYWVKGLYAQDEHIPLLQEGEYVDMKADCYSLTGELLMSHQATVLLSQIDDIPVIGLVLPLMQRGQKVSLLVPWYLAFGSVGNGRVPAYENIRVELSVQ